VKLTEEERRIDGGVNEQGIGARLSGVFYFTTFNNNIRAHTASKV